MSPKSTEQDRLSITRRGFLFSVSATAVSLSLPSIPKFGFDKPTNVHLIRHQIWCRQVKEALLDDLVSIKFKEIKD